VACARHAMCLMLRDATTGSAVPTPGASPASHGPFPPPHRTDAQDDGWTCPPTPPSPDSDPVSPPGEVAVTYLGPAAEARSGPGDLSGYRSPRNRCTR
jgi:hypothetical protein